MNKGIIYVTKEARDKIEKEIEYLKVVKKKELAEEMKIARGFGDISENAEYQSVREEMIKLDETLLQLEEKFVQMRIIKESNVDKSKVNIGSKVKLLDIEFDEECTYKVLGYGDEDEEGIESVSSNSPMGSAIIGAKVGDTIEVKAPMGMFKYKILEIVH